MIGNEVFLTLLLVSFFSHSKRHVYNLFAEVLLTLSLGLINHGLQLGEVLLTALEIVDHCLLRGQLRSINSRLRAVHLVCVVASHVFDRVGLRWVHKNGFHLNLAAH